MKIRLFLTALVLAAMAVNALALSAEYLEWGRGPAQFIMTKEEAAKWKTITTDDDAKAFVALFWARRDPTPETPRNEFREEYDKRVATADKNFPGEKVRGAMTDRGRALVLFGMPKKMERTGNQRDSAMPQGINTPGIGSATGDPVGGFTSRSNDPLNPAADNTAAQVWTYEGDDARKMFNQGRAVIRFVDRNGKSEFTMERGSLDFAAAQNRVNQAALKQPNLTTAPVFATVPVGEASTVAMGAPPVPEAPVVQTELTTESLKAAVNELKSASKTETGKSAFVTYGEYITASGEYFVPVQLYVPKSSGISGQNLTFFGVVQDETGKNVAAFEVPATLNASKDDFYVDRSLALPAGKNRGFFGLAENGTPVTLVATDMQLAGTLDKEAAAASQLILSNNVYPLTEAQKSTDPYAFGGLKVVPKGDRTFRSSDELWYFVELRNPGTPVAQIPADGAAEAPPAVPKVQIKIDVEGTDKTGKKVKMAAPPREIEAIEIKGVPGHYGIGSAIPLTSFKPGDYTFTVKVIDTVKKASYSMTEKFRVVE